MKIQCDVCDKDEASVFCAADEAALCAACDNRIHHANKLAGKHQRFSIHHPSPDQSPLCDICRERKAFLFCQQDRAIMCMNCDTSIHKANEHTKKHTRFLLTGVKLSSTSVIYSLSTAESASSNSKNSAKSEAIPNLKSTTVQRIGVPIPESCDKSNSQFMINFKCQNSASSSISEYLIEMLPGWPVDDFLDSPSPIKNGEYDGLPFWDADFDAKTSVQRMGSWVPQAPPTHLHHQTNNHSNQFVDFISFGIKNGIEDQSKQFHNNNNTKSSRKWSEDNSFTVPQISPPSSVFKRSKTLW